MSKITERISKFCRKHPFINSCVHIGENVFKKPIFGCQDCGQCVLSYNAYVCPMRCPKQLRNGPCGGTREDYHCEVYPERYCVWWKINNRSQSKWLSMITSQRKLRKYHKPIDNRLVNTSAWINMFDGTIEKISFSKDIPKEDVALPKKKL